jgi:branched-chain amino acid transport system permease protein
MLGAAVYIILQNYLSDITARWPLFMGLIFIFMVLIIPGGLSQIIQSIKTLFTGKRGTGNPIAVKEVSS